MNYEWIRAVASVAFPDLACRNCIRREIDVTVYPKDNANQHVSEIRLFIFGCAPHSAGHLFPCHSPLAFDSSGRADGFLAKSFFFSLHLRSFRFLKCFARSTNSFSLSNTLCHIIISLEKRVEQLIEAKWKIRCHAMKYSVGNLHWVPRKCSKWTQKIQEKYRQKQIKGENDYEQRETWLFQSNHFAFSMLRWSFQRQMLSSFVGNCHQFRQKDNGQKRWTLHSTQWTEKRSKTQPFRRVVHAKIRLNRQQTIFYFTLYFWLTYISSSHLVSVSTIPLANYN